MQTARVKDGVAVFVIDRVSGGIGQTDTILQRYLNFQVVND